MEEQWGYLCAHSTTWLGVETNVGTRSKEGHCNSQCYNQGKAKVVVLAVEVGEQARTWMHVEGHANRSCPPSLVGKMEWLQLRCGRLYKEPGGGGAGEDQEFSFGHVWFETLFRYSCGDVE